MTTLTLDIETLKLASDLPGGWDALRRGEGGISCLVLWDSIEQRPHLHDLHTLSRAVDRLEAASLVLTFNGRGFDIPVLEGVIGRKIVLAQHLDMLRLVWDALDACGERRKGNSLGECSQRTLGTAKSGDGLLAPQLAAEGRWAELLDYCLMDVILTRKLFLYAQEHGGIVGPSGDLLPLDLPPWFQDAKL